MTTTEELYKCFLSCSSVSTDTRKIEPNSLFIALKGDNFDANTFAEEALSKGASYAVVDNPEYKTGERILLVENSLKSLQQLANYHRRQLGLPIIALTGSNGKTTTKELINAILSKKYNTIATIGNLNNHIGVPLTLLSLTHNTEIGIVEMGANHKKEIEALCEIAEPNFGYVTNFGKAHLEGFGGLEGVIEGKSELYTYLKEHTKTVFVNLDDNVQREKTKDMSRFTFAVDDYNCDVRIETAKSNPMVTVKYKGTDIHSNLIGIYNANNINVAITIGTYFKISDTKIKETIRLGGTPNSAVTPATSRFLPFIVSMMVMRSFTNWLKSLSPLETITCMPCAAPMRASVPMTSSASTSGTLSTGQPSSRTTSWIGSIWLRRSSGMGERLAL